MDIQIKDLTRVLKGELVLGDPRVRVKRAVVDSRKVEAGDIFFALKGARVDGHDFALSACTNGASGAVVSRLEWLKSVVGFGAAVIRVEDPLQSLSLLGEYLRSTFKGPVIGITGSNGKTTTKQMLASIMKTHGEGLFTQGNYNSQIGLPLTLSTLESNHKWMVLELGASAVRHIELLSNVCHPTVGVITSIGYEHLESFGNLQNIASTHWELMEALPNDGCAVIPWGESHLEPFIRNFKKRIIFFGEDSSCTVRASALEIGEQLKFLLHLGQQTIRVCLSLPGRYNIINALASAAAAWSLGVPAEKIVAGLENFEPPKMRMEIFSHNSGAILINDAYNANPSSMIQSARSIIETYPKKNRVLVLGSMLELGAESDKMHFHVGTEIGRLPVHRLYLVGVESKGIKEGAISVGLPADKVKWFDSSEAAADSMGRELNKDTVILLKGSRGIQLEYIVQALQERS